MSYDRNETRELIDTIVLGGVTVTNTKVSYDYKPWSRTGDAPTERSSYTDIKVEGEDSKDELVALNNVRIVLETLSQMDELTFGEYDLENLVELIEETASEIAEDLEIHFIYDRDGSVREYTPRSLWEPSGSCEWEESASEYDYGWDL